jgi:hypothetical protein
MVVPVGVLAAGLLLAITNAAASAPAVPQAEDKVTNSPGRHRHGGGGGGPGGPGGQGGMREAMSLIHVLLDNHRTIQRIVHEIDGGVETWTTSDDPQVAQAIQTHVRQMRDRLPSGRPVRPWDPLFEQLFLHHRFIEMKIEDIPGGVRVLETSADPQVMLLIRQHATRGVSRFVRDGRKTVHQETPMPEGSELRQQDLRVAPA